MKTIMVTFRVSTNYINTEVKEDVEVLVEEAATEDQIDDTIQAHYEDWLFNNTQQSWDISD